MSCHGKFWKIKHYKGSKELAKVNLFLRRRFGATPGLSEGPEGRGPEEVGAIVGVKQRTIGPPWIAIE